MSESCEHTVAPASFSMGRALSWGGSVPLQPPLPLPDPKNPALPEAAGQERLLRLTLPDTHLTVAQERAAKARHGRYETRTLWALTSADLNRYLGPAGTVGKPWPGVQQVCRIQRVVVSRDRKSGAWKTTAEVAYSITSLGAKRADAGDLLRRSRVHWHIENRLHWVRDVTFGEDASQIHKGQAPEVFAVLRNAAISLLEWGGSPTIAAAPCGTWERGLRPPSSSSPAWVSS